MVTSSASLLGPFRKAAACRAARAGAASSKVLDEAGGKIPRPMGLAKAERNVLRCTTQASPARCRTSARGGSAAVECPHSPAPGRPVCRAKFHSHHDWVYRSNRRRRRRRAHPTQGRCSGEYRTNPASDAASSSPWAQAQQHLMLPAGRPHPPLHRCPPTPSEALTRPPLRQRPAAYLQSRSCCRGRGGLMFHCVAATPPALLCQSRPTQACSDALGVKKLAFTRRF